MNFSSSKEVTKYIKEKNIEGWFGGGEGANIFKLICETPIEFDVVELGSFMGRSTIYIAAAGKVSGRSKIITVDHFEGSSEHPGLGYTPQMIREGFFKNIKEVGFEDYIEVMDMSTHEASQKYNGQIAILFIDAAHEYKSIKQDFEDWYPKVISGGWIIIHDAVFWENPKRVFNEAIAEGKLIETFTCDTSGFGKKP